MKEKDQSCRTLGSFVRKVLRLLFRRKHRPRHALSFVASTGRGALGFELVFRFFDGDGDGKICSKDLKRGIMGLGERLFSDVEAELVVELMDSDGDGLVGLEDFLRMVGGVQDEEEKVSDLKEAFAMYVTQERGVITSKSLKRTLAKLGETTTTADCASMIRRFDLNGDGVINFDEFLIMMI